MLAKSICSNQIEWVENGFRNTSEYVHNIKFWPWIKILTMFSMSCRNVWTGQMNIECYSLYLFLSHSLARSRYRILGLFRHHFNCQNLHVDVFVCVYDSELFSSHGYECIHWIICPVEMIKHSYFFNEKYISEQHAFKSGCIWHAIHLDETFFSLSRSLNVSHYFLLFLRTKMKWMQFQLDPINE